MATYDEGDLRRALFASDEDQVVSILEKRPKLIENLDGELLSRYLDRLPQAREYAAQMRKLQSSGAATREAQQSRNAQALARAGMGGNSVAATRLGNALSNQQALAQAARRRQLESEYQRQLNASDRYAGSSRAIEAARRGFRRKAGEVQTTTGAIGTGLTAAGRAVSNIPVVGAVAGPVLEAAGMTTTLAGQAGSADQLSQAEGRLGIQGRAAQKTPLPQYASAAPAAVQGFDFDPYGRQGTRSFFDDPRDDDDGTVRWGMVYG